MLVAGLGLRIEGLLGSGRKDCDWISDRALVWRLGCWGLDFVGTWTWLLGALVLRGPVRAAEGRICSKPCEAATCSIDLKYYRVD